MIALDTYSLNCLYMYIRYVCANICEYYMRYDICTHHRERNSSSFINGEQFTVCEFVSILRLDVLDSLPVVSEHIDAHNCFVEGRV